LRYAASPWFITSSVVLLIGDQYGYELQYRNRQWQNAEKHYHQHFPQTFSVIRLGCENHSLSLTWLQPGDSVPKWLFRRSVDRLHSADAPSSGFNHCWQGRTHMESGNRTRRGHTLAPDAREAVAAFHAQVAQPGMAAVLFFCSPSYDRDVLANEINRHFFSA
jgi:hypothetical protein